MSKSCPKFNEYFLILLIFCICLTGALLLPEDQCPDETGRRFLSNWIVVHRELPTGDELGTMLMSWVDASAEVPQIVPDAEYQGWGFSYALRPYLSSMIGAGFQILAASFTNSPRILLAASRMCSVLSITACCIFSLRMGHRIFASRSSPVLFAVLVCFLPQVMFLGMYQNNDSLSLCAVSMMLYYWVESYDRKWPVRSCVGLAVALSLGLLSYYSAYGWLLMVAVFCVFSVLSDHSIPDRGQLILKRTVLITAVCLILAGWFFIRNAYLHNGDFLGIASEAASRSRMEALGYRLTNYVRYREKGVSIPAFLYMDRFWWLLMTLMSFIGVFGYMNILLPPVLYILYALVITCGLVLFVVSLARQKPNRRDSLLMIMMLLASVITFLLHFWQCYARDFQPQGRYIITIALPLGFVLAYGLDKLPNRVNDRLHPATVLTLGWLALSVWATLGTMAKMLP